MNEYRLVNNPSYREELSTGEIKVKVQRTTEYSIYYGDICFLDIKDYIKDAETIGNALVDILNRERKIIIKPEI